ncbi:MAG: hypothetical protein IJ840_07365 [Bacteroidales bacterium]|nr:hypothetical protein [Bacteroidales bacterium]
MADPLKKLFRITALPLILSFLMAEACGTALPEETDWGKIIESYVDDDHQVDYLKLSRLNMALAETGQLTDKLFHYTQAGSDGILVQWNRAKEAGELLSDTYWSMGHIALAQRMAFEATVMDERDLNPEMTRRLIETNLIYGAYPVAGKYIEALGKDRAWRRVAESYRVFLYNDAAVDSDLVLGPRKRCVPKTDFISMVRGIDEDLKDIIRTNPGYNKAIEYLGAIYLLNCEMDKFKEMVDEFYGTEALPELHGSFAEAACMLSEIHRGYWKTVGVPAETYKRYTDFKARLGNGLSQDKYKDTFWYYIMRVNSQ